jgi:SecD/SecF fusion protein
VSRHLGWRLVAVLLLAGAAGWMVVTRPARLGLDLRGAPRSSLRPRTAPTGRSTATPWLLGLFAWLGKPLDGVFLAGLFFLGGDTLTDFALALLVGILVGTYSSVFVATPLLVAFEQRAGGQPATALSRAWRSRPSPARSRR